MNALPRILTSAILACAGLQLTWLARAQNVTQNFTLQPGWNAVFLEVQPADNSANAVFSGLPVASVWTRAERVTSAEFIQNASEAAFNEAGWLRWFHTSRPEAFLNNLHAVLANQPYLIRSTNATPVGWSVTGRPSLRRNAWVTDAYNLRGLPVDPITPPTFLNFFRHSPAHFNTANGQLEKIYRLNSSGQWAQVSSNEFTRSGEAYWIYTRGASDYLAPLQVSLELGDGLDYGTELTELPIRLKNVTSGPMSASIQNLGGGPAALAYYEFSSTLGAQWHSLPSPLVAAPGPGGEVRVRLGIRRQNISGAEFGSVLEVKNGAGVRFLIPVTAEKANVTPGMNQYAGLWVGLATINAVSEVTSASDNPTPTKSEMNLRLIVHVNASGQARLLKEVIQMWRNGTTADDGQGNQIVTRPGEYVLLTDDTLISQFSGATIRDSESVGRRLSTVGYDFPSGNTNNFVNLIGTFGIGSSLFGVLTMSYDSPTSPFKHKYHPDHDNLNARFDGPVVESYTTTRQIILTFESSAPPGGPAVPDFGYNLMGGTYREIISGLHKKAIQLRGTFRLTRLSEIAVLNPSPTP